MKIIASIFGIGYIGKGGGTVAAIAAAILWYALAPLHFSLQILLVLITMVLGVWSGNIVEADWGKDSSKVVIDEVIGLFIAMLFVPVTIPYLLTGLILFRFFDIAKPLGVRSMEQYKGGWGVMMDDVLAGVYANILLQIIVYTNVLAPLL